MPQGWQTRLISTAYAKQLCYGVSLKQGKSRRLRC